MLTTVMGSAWSSWRMTVMPLGSCDLTNGISTVSAACAAFSRGGARRAPAPRIRERSGERRESGLLSDRIRERYARNRVVLQPVRSGEGRAFFLRDPEPRVRTVPLWCGSDRQGGEEAGR